MGESSCVNIRRKNAHLYPFVQAWIEASTKGAVLLFTASEIESATVAMGVNPAAAGLLGGMGGGIAQAYATMGASSSTCSYGLLLRFAI